MFLDYGLDPDETNGRWGLNLTKWTEKNERLKSQMVSMNPMSV